MVLTEEQLCTRPVTGRHLTTSGDTSGRHRLGDPTGIKWVKARDVLRHPTMHRTGSTVKNHHAQNDDSANPALMLHIQVFAGFCHAIFMSLQVHFTHCYIPRASHTTWSMVCSWEQAVLFLWEYFFFKRIPIEKFAFMQMVFICLPQLVYTLSFHVTCFYIAFLYQLPLGSVLHDALVNNFAETHTDNT